MSHDTRRPSLTRCIRPIATCASVLACSIALSVHADELPTADFADLSLEQLGDIEVMSVSKRAEPLSTAPASIYVITNEAIRRSGAKTLPEALRLAPNLQVAQINANQYAISARGFNSTTANKLQVLIDGRAIYTPLYSGVFWDSHDLVLGDVERIEVISGAGGTLWGANAVNGVINVITRSAVGTGGVLARAVAGDMLQSATFRYGHSAHGRGWRMYAKYIDHDNYERVNGVDVADGWERIQTGFRSDWEHDDATVTLQGDAYEARLDNPSTQPLYADDRQRLRGANVVGRWTRATDAGGELRAQGYLDYVGRYVPGSYEQRLTTVDLDLQHTFAQDGPGQWVWGAGYRRALDRVEDYATFAFLPNRRTLQWFNAYAQYRRQLHERLLATIGARLEHNTYTGLEVLPSVRLAWTPSDRDLWWLGLSRGVRTPSRIDTEFFAPAQPPFVLLGNDDFEAEVVVNLGTGHRRQWSDTLTTSMTAFVTDYDRLRSLDRLPGGRFVLGNTNSGRTYGLEGWGTWQLSERWRLDGGFVLLREDFDGPNLALARPGNDPRLQWSLGSSWNIAADHMLDVRVRHVGQLPAPRVERYTAVDARYGWKVTKHVELALTGRNLFDPSHNEFASGSSAAALTNVIEVPRSVHAEVIVRF